MLSPDPKREVRAGNSGLERHKLGPQSFPIFGTTRER